MNKAIRADSTYLDAYNLKFGSEEELKRYNDLIITGKKILKLSPGRPEIIYRIGECYELTGKIDSAKSYYRQALLLYDQELSNPDKNNGYDSYEMSKKALVLILLNREQEGRAIFKQLSESPSIDEYEKQLYHNYLTTPRDKFLKDLKP